MSELNREQIIKALECCADTSDIMKCQSCPYMQPRSGCNTKLMRDSLALIKELTDENFLLEQKRVNMFEILDAYGHGRTDAVRKFADYLKKQSFNCDPGNGFSFDAIDVDELGNYVKGFLEEDEYEKDT